MSIALKEVNESILGTGESILGTGENEYKGPKTTVCFGTFQKQQRGLCLE